MIAFTRALAIDHVQDGIRVNCVCPGTIDTPWIDRVVDELGESRDGLVARQPLGRSARPTRSPKRSPTWRRTARGSPPAASSSSTGA